MKICNFINRVFGYLERKIYSRWFNPFATIYLNFRTLSLKQAIKFPIFVYGRVKFYSLSGNIIINGNINTGMIKLGRHDDIYDHSPYGIISLSKNAKIIFNGYCSIAAGYIWRIHDKGQLSIGEFSGFGNSCKIFCSNNIEIGKYSRIAYNCILMDTNSHFSIDLIKKQIANKIGVIKIGDKSWIGNNCRILKGCKIGTGSIVATGSMVNKDYSSFKKSLLAGTPAKVKYEGITRCFSFTLEKEINKYFESNPQTDTMLYDKEFIDPVEDLIQFFK